MAKSLTRLTLLLESDNSEVVEFKTDYLSQVVQEVELTFYDRGMVIVDAIVDTVTSI